MVEPATEASHSTLRQEPLDLLRVFLTTCLAVTLVIGPGIAVWTLWGRPIRLAFLPLFGIGAMLLAGRLAWCLHGVLATDTACFRQHRDVIASFNVTPSSTLPGAVATVLAPSFTPPAPDATTHRSSGSETVTVAVPKTAKPGVYEVTLTAKTPQGGTATQVAKIEVTQPKLKLGKVKLNKKNGTAKLSIGVPSAGTLTVSGKGIAKVQRKPAGPKPLKVTIKAKASQRPSSPRPERPR